MLDDAPEASLQSKFPDIGNAVAPAAILSGKGYAQPAVGCWVAVITPWACHQETVLYPDLHSSRQPPKCCNEHDARFGVRFSV